MAPVTREELHRSTGEAHRMLQSLHFELTDIARSVSYLHPDLAAELRAISAELEKARNTLQGNEAQLLHIDHQAAMNGIGEIFGALLARGEEPEPGPVTLAP